jgi:hypothetical protein
VDLEGLPVGTGGPRPVQDPAAVIRQELEHGVFVGDQVGGPTGLRPEQHAQFHEARR